MLYHHTPRSQSKPKTTMSVFAGAAAPQLSIAPTDCNILQAGEDGISSLNWSPNANILVSSNWDGGVRCWEVQEQGGQIRAMPKAQSKES
jgi:mRNA export factor